MSEVIKLSKAKTILDHHFECYLTAIKYYLFVLTFYWDYKKKTILIKIEDF